MVSVTPRGGSQRWGRDLMAQTHEGPRRHGGQRRVRYAQQGALYRLPPSLRTTVAVAASTAKWAIVAGANYHLIPPRLAEWLIQRGGLRHA